MMVSLQFNSGGYCYETEESDELYGNENKIGNGYENGHIIQWHFYKSQNGNNVKTKA